MKSIIIYATKYGCTEKAAKILQSRMKGEVLLVDITKSGVSDLNDYDTVILGGSIYVGRIQKALTKFIDANLPSLLQKQLGLFICGGQPEPIRTKELEEAFPTPLFNHATARDVFGYEYNFDKLGVLDKLIVRKVAGVTKSTFELSRQKIETFAQTLKSSSSNQD